jgi:sn-glycerol 3-phosphate transport system substrate-binding protein
MKTRRIISLLLLVVVATWAGVVSAQAVPPKVTGPVKITVWHTRAAGANGDQIAGAVAQFNATNKLGITVEEVYQGSYEVTLAKTMQAVAAGTNPQMVVLERAAGVPVLAEQGVLLDMMPYIKRDGFDIDNIVPVFKGYSIYKDQFISMPYIRSTPLFYYNKDLFAKAGYTEAPKTIAELIDAGKKVTVVSKGETLVYGFEMMNDPAWFIQNMLVQMGSNLFSADGKSVPCLKDGTMLKALSAWREWVDAGWCTAPTVTKAESVMKDLFNQGKIASYFASSGGMTNILNSAKAAGIKVGVAFLPTWDKPSAPVGGGNMAIIAKNNTPQQLAAAWEFMKFLMSDEQVAQNAADTGYLPVTFSSAKAKVLQDLWKAQPEYKVAFDQLAIAQEMPWSAQSSEFIAVMKTVCSELIMDRSITPQQAVKSLEAEAAVIFPR